MLRKILTAACFIFVFNLSYANNENPVEMLNNTIVKTQDLMIKDTKLYQSNPYKLLELINEKIMPIVDPKIIAQLVVGSDKWNKATESEQNEFVKYATEMLTFMYAKNVAYAGKYKMILFNFDNNDWENKKLIVVNGKIINNSNDQSSDFSIKMFRKNIEDGWKIYDFDISGVSVLETYKQQFAEYKSVPKMTKAAIKVTDRIKKKNYPNLVNK